MRTLLSLLCLVALSQARPENAASPQTPELDSEAVQAVLKVLPRITESFKGDTDAGATLRRVTYAVLDAVRENAPEDRRQQVDDASQLTNSILDTVAEMVKDLPKFDIPTFKNPTFEIPEIVIPKVDIPDIPEIVIPEFNIPQFQTDDSFKVPEIVIPKFNIPDIPEVVVPAFEAPKIDIPEF